MATQSLDPDPDSIILSAVFIFFLVLFSGFFSATETAFTSLNKTKLKLKAQSGSKPAQNALDLAGNFDSLLSTILVGNNIVNITMSVLFNNIFEQVISNAAVSGIVSVAVSTVIVLTFGEITPKMIAKENSETLAMVFGYPIKAIKIILTPITIIFAGLKWVLRKIFKQKKEDVITEEELLSMVDEAQEGGSLGEEERDLISGAIEFTDAEVGDIFVPRINIISIPIDMPMEKIKSMFLEYNFSRMPVYKGTIDGIVGMIHNIDFFTALEKGEKSIKNYINPVAIATEHMKISILLKNMQQQHVHMAVVVDEYGGTLGIVTLEDILEELVGEIWDEHDEVVNYFNKLTDTSYMVDARVELDKFFEFFGIDSSETEKFDSQTVSGWIMEKIGDIPKKQQTFDFENLTITVERLTARRIVSVKVVVNPIEQEDDDEDKPKKHRWFGNTEENEEDKGSETEQTSSEN